MTEKFNPYKTIHMQYDEDFEGFETWCKDKTDESDEQYILKSEYDELEKQNEELECCGNCYNMDIIMDKGSVCTFGKEEIPCDRNGYCDEWAINKE